MIELKSKIFTKKVNKVEPENTYFQFFIIILFMLFLRATGMPVLRFLEFISFL
jgi:hypothetical protein